MSRIASKLELQKACRHLAQHDARLAPIMRQYGDCTLQPHHNYYQALVDSIISQQLSVHAARAIETRFQALFGGHFPSAHEILTTDIETLRGLGFSRAKASYVLDLAQHIVDGKITFERIDSLSNQAIITKLTAVKGIGEWTVQMFLMFCMGRLDILPTGDLGVRNGVGRLYGFATTPSPQQVTTVAEQNHWHPYESVASWYIWQSLDNKPAL